MVAVRGRITSGTRPVATADDGEDLDPAETVPTREIMISNVFPVDVPTTAAAWAPPPGTVDHRPVDGPQHQNAHCRPGSAADRVTGGARTNAGPGGAEPPPHHRDLRPTLRQIPQPTPASGRTRGIGAADTAAGRSPVGERWTC